MSGQQETDEATLQQIKDIAQNVEDSQPLIAESSSVLDALHREYENNTDSPGFLTGLNYLNHKYSRIRRVRGDGNCFYRAVLFAYLETLTNNLNSGSAVGQIEYDRVLKVIQGSKEDLVNVGYEEFAVEDFHETFVEFFQRVPSLTPATLLEHFTQGSEADYYTWYMRLLTAGYLRQHGERFFPFLAEGLDLDMTSYCAREVEPMGRECEQLHIIALTEYLGLRVRIEYLDGREFDAASGLSCVEFPQLDAGSSLPADLCSFAVQLLYRPGHYDILYTV